MREPTRRPYTRPMLRIFCFWLAASAAAAQPPAPKVETTTAAAPAIDQTQDDDYTRYELLQPGSGKFRILYEVTATSPGATFFWNVIRKGSIATNERVINPENGEPLPFEIVNGEKARQNGHRRAALDTDYIQITLPRPVPKNGEIRLLIDKTYEDAKSYFVEEGTGYLVFSRSLGIKRNALILPVGFEIVSCNYPSQVAPEADGRLRLSYFAIGPDAVSYVVKARKVK